MNASSRLGRWSAFWLVILTLASTMALAGVAPSTASACDYGRCPGYPVATPLAELSYTGWTYLELNDCTLSCPLMNRTSVPAWKWTSTGWTYGSISGGWVYVAPLGSGYRWAWTQASGWVAISGYRFEIRAY